jgi:hypothetical protein
VDLEDFGFVEDILEARAGFGCDLYEFLENSLCTVEVHAQGLCQHTPFAWWVARATTEPCLIVT